MLASNTITHCRETIQNHLRKEPEPFNLEYVQNLLDTIIAFSRVLQSDVSSSSSPGSASSSHAMSVESSPAATGSAFPGYQFQPHTQQQQQQQSPQSHHSPDQQQQHNSPLIYFPSLTPRLLTLSSLILLLDIYCNPENLRGGPSPSSLEESSVHAPKSHAELTMQVCSVSLLRETALSIRSMSLELMEAVVLPSGLCMLGPLCLDALYGAMATLHWLWKEGGEEGIRGALEDVKRCMSPPPPFMQFPLSMVLAPAEKNVLTRA